jgi:hypothetical protein
VSRASRGDTEQARARRSQPRPSRGRATERPWPERRCARPERRRARAPSRRASAERHHGRAQRRPERAQRTARAHAGSVRCADDRAPGRRPQSEPEEVGASAGRGTERNSPARVDAGESPRSAPSAPPLTSLRDRSSAKRQPIRDMKVVPGNFHDRLGFLAVPRLWGFPDTPQAQAVRFPTRTHRYSESPYGSSPARFPASICSAAWDRQGSYGQRARWSTGP